MTPYRAFQFLFLIFFIFSAYFTLSTCHSLYYALSFDKQKRIQATDIKVEKQGAYRYLLLLSYRASKTEKIQQEYYQQSYINPWSAEAQKKAFLKKGVVLYTSSNKASINATIPTKDLIYSLLLLICCAYLFLLMNQARSC